MSVENRKVVAGDARSPPHELPRRPLFRRALGRLVRLAPVPSSFALSWILLSRDLESTLPRPGEGDGYEYRWGGPAEIEWISSQPDTAKAGAHYRRAERGHRCFCAVRDGTVAAFGWVNRESGCTFLGEANETRFLPLASDEAFGHDLYTYPAHRHRGVAFAMKCAQYRELQREGVRRVYVAVLLSRRPSLRLHRRLGARPERLAYSYFLGGIRGTSLGPRRRIDHLAEWFDRV